MSKQKPFEANIDGFYKKCSIDMALFGWVEGWIGGYESGWVEGITKILPAVTEQQAREDLRRKLQTKNITVSEKKAIEKFLDYMKLSEDDYPITSAQSIYSRIKNDFLWKTKI